MNAEFQYGGNEFPLETGVDSGVQVSLDEAPDGRPLLFIATPRSGEDLTVEQAELLGRALLSWAADMRLVTS